MKQQTRFYSLLTFASLLTLTITGCTSRSSNSKTYLETYGTTTSTAISISPSTDPPATTSTVSTSNFQAALSVSSQEIDEVDGITTYRAATSPKYVNENGFFIYVRQKDNLQPTIRLRIQYAGDSWLFISSYLINVDGTKYSIFVDYFDVKRDSDSQVWEWFDKIPSPKERVMLEQIAQSKKTIVRMRGDQYYKDFELNSTQKNAIKTMLTIYFGLGGR